MANYFLSLHFEINKLIFFSLDHATHLILLIYLSIFKNNCFN